MGAHSGDFCGGRLSAWPRPRKGGVAQVVAFSYGERGESQGHFGTSWTRPSSSEEGQDEQAEEAAQVMGASFECWDLGDYPLRVSEETLEWLAEEVDSPLPVVPPHRAGPFPPGPPGGPCSRLEGARIC